MMRPRARGQKPPASSTSHARVFKGKLLVATPQEIAKGWSTCFPDAPSAETQLFLPTESLYETTEDQDTMLHAIAEVSPYAARTVLEAAIFLACQSSAAGLQLDQFTPISFANQWAFQKWMLIQAKNAKAALTRAVRTARCPSEPVNQPPVIQNLVHIIRGSNPHASLSSRLPIPPQSCLASLPSWALPALLPIKRQATPPSELPCQAAKALDPDFWDIPPHLLELARPDPPPLQSSTPWFSDYHGAVVRMKGGSQEEEVAGMVKGAEGFWVGRFQDGTVAKTEKSNILALAPAPPPPEPTANQTGAPEQGDEAATPGPTQDLTGATGQGVEVRTPAPKAGKKQGKTITSSTKKKKGEKQQTGEAAASSKKIPPKAQTIKAKPEAQAAKPKAKSKAQAAKPKAKPKAQAGKAKGDDQNRPPPADDREAWLAFRPQGCSRCRQVPGCTKSCRHSELQKRKWQ